MEGKGKTGGAIAIGTVAIAITYLTAGFQSDPAPSVTNDTNPPAVQASPLNVKKSGEQRPYDSVTVFYGTDRASVTHACGARHQEVQLAGLAAGAGLLAFAAWFIWRGKIGFALASGGLAVATSVALVVWTPLFVDSRGISEAYVSGCRYGGDRGDLELGYCVVTIPRTHHVGELEKPSILRLELKASAERHLMLQEVVHQPNKEFYEAVRQRVTSSPHRDLFVFVHGFNVDFVSAARRTAQIAFDLNYGGAPVFFSWPSQGKTWQYTVDETNVTWAVPHLKQFLTELARNSDAQAINLIAHSMGNRALTQAIYELGYECQEEKKLFRQVILAAPDIDADVFRDQIAPKLAKYSSQVTLYASSADEALAASKLVHGSRRAGESSTQPLTVPGVETIDVATNDLGPLGHSYYGSCPLILQDLAAILLDACPAERRPWLAPIRGTGAMYWRLMDTPAMASSGKPPARIK